MHQSDLMERLRAPRVVRAILPCLCLLIPLLTRSDGAVPSTPYVPKQQAQALAAVAQAFPVKATATWLQTSPCAAWSGVTCDASGAVISLTLSLSELPQPASIPSTIALLTNLKTLQLNGGVNGTLPAALSSLVWLQTLDLSGNQISGPLPSLGWGNFYALSTLSISYNQLSGSLPASLGSLRTLVNLLAGKNQLSGSIPDMFKPLNSLQALDLSSNQLYGAVPGSLAGVPKLAFLDLSNNLLSGAIPNNFASSLIGDALNGTYRVSGNFFSGSPVPFSAGQPFCPVMQVGGHAAASLAGYRVSQLSSEAGNCLVTTNSTWSATAWKAYASKGAQGNKGLKSWGSRRCRGLGWGANCGSSSDPFSCYTETQKTPQLCLAFCNSLDPQGPCGGLGTCYPSPSTSQSVCSCVSGAWNTWPPTSIGAPMVDPVLAQIVPVFPSCTRGKNNVYPQPPVTYTKPTGVYTFGLISGQLPAVAAVSARTAGKSAGGARKVQAVSIPALNPFFRYASLGFTGTYASPSWAVSVATDWRRALGGAASFVTGAKDQGSCASCWAFAPVAAVEAAVAIAYSALPPNASEQQVVDCQGTWGCTGGIPNDALAYLVSARPGLTLSALYPYTSSLGTCKAISTTSKARLSGIPPPPYNAQMYEQTTLGGWFGMLLAVQVQPVVASIEADALSFLTFPGGSVYNDPACFANQIINHNVVVVGYNLAAPVPYWIIKNSWGANWGDTGFMNLAIGGGVGICGINYVPALYPVVKGPNPCAPFNPCGGGTCSINPSSPSLNLCSCPTNFMAVTNVDSTQSCAPIRVCNLFSSNPCGFGTCVDDMAGSYNCLCPPPSFTAGVLASGPPTCVPGNASRTVVAAAGMTCDLIRVAFALSRAAFTAQNNNLNCNPLVTGSVVNVANPGYTGCQTFYPASSGDTCVSIAGIFGISATDVMALNPDINCTGLAQGQQVCVQPGSPAAYVCTQYYAVAPGDTCSSIAQMIASPPLSPQQFYSYNPGLLCSNLVPTPADSGTASNVSSSTLSISSSYASVFGTQVCISAVPLNVSTGLTGVTKCVYGVYYVIGGDTCLRLYAKVYCNKPTLFVKYNGFACSNLGTVLYVGRSLCRPPSSCT